MKNNNLFDHDDKISCSELIAKLYEFIDNELDANTCEQFRMHLEKCKHCKDCAKAEKHIRNILQNKCFDKAPKDLKEKIHLNLLKHSK